MKSIATLLEQLQSLLEVNWPTPSQGDGIFRALPVTTQSAVRDATQRRAVQIRYISPTPGSLVVAALKVYNYGDPTREYRPFLRMTGLTQLNMDQIAMAAMEAGWE